MEFKARFIGEAPRCIRKRRNRRYAELIDIRPAAARPAAAEPAPGVPAPLGEPPECSSGCG